MIDRKWKLCAAIVDKNPGAVAEVEPLVDFFEVRIDLIGSGWREIASGLGKPWIACNRRAGEGGNWRGSESDRVDELIGALDLGAAVIDIELASPDITSIISKIKGRAQCLLSHHDLQQTPALDEMKDIVARQLDAGADICKVVTTARKTSDNITVLQLISAFPDNKIISFAMGSLGHLSRVLSPLVGAYLTYASIREGQGSAPGQMTTHDLDKLYSVLGTRVVYREGKNAAESI